ncbi:transcription factor GTE2-like [Hordeum vulgare subsp. vulgare]|uniref:Uncharacterized protein n=1 Tax=Hordeum vulgare subsp. vulgare TaxID=112509 RepID=A0A8I6WVY9_HORVV|nr:transcription factor GTE2-like [Hordeum vulgare subsp. vulgare]
MASALIAGRRGQSHHWRDNRGPLAPAPTPNPGPRALPPADGSRTHHPPASPGVGYVTFRPSGLTHREASALRDRLAGELGQVRALLSRIDAWQQELELEQQRQPRRGPPTEDGLPAPPPKLRAAMRKRCAQILAKLRKDKRSIWFNAPVEVETLGLHDYHAVIKSPMDLGTVKANLAARNYPSHDAFAADVRLTFANALRYNPVGHTVHTFAGDLLASFEKTYAAAVSWFEEECRRLPPPVPVPVLVPVSVSAELPPPVVPLPAQVKPRAVRMRKPKARELNKRQMSLEEKNMLRAGLENLPEEKMHNVLQIVRKRNVNNPELLGDEIELDIDEMDIETQWELDRFVSNFNKALKKSQRAAMINGDIADVNNADGAEAVNGAVPILVDIVDVESENPENTVVPEQVDEYIDIDDEMPTATYQSLEIQKDAEATSVSGGSGSGSSSSSGSGSGSSGDSTSEAGDARSLV